MADAEIRALARQANADPEAEGRLLRARLRDGSLDRERLALAAAAGHEAAVWALGVTPEREDPILREWVWNFLPHGRDVILRALHACCERVSPHVELPEGDTRLEEGLDRFQAWCDAPELERSQGEIDQLEELLGDVVLGLGHKPESMMAAHALYRTVTAASLPASRGKAHKAFMYEVDRTLEELRTLLQEDVLREVVRDSLREWALAQREASR